MDSQNQQYTQKLEELKKDLPFLLKVLAQLRNSNMKDPGRQSQLEKMQKLYDLINDKSQILKWETLLKCETVVKKLQKRMDKLTEVEFKKTLPDNKQALRQDEIFKTTKGEKDVTPTAAKLDEIPVPESPPPQQESDIEILPIEIPTEWRNSPPLPLIDIDYKKEQKPREHRTTHSHHNHHQHHSRFHKEHHHYNHHRESTPTFHGTIKKHQSDHHIHASKNDNDHYRDNRRLENRSANNNKHHASETDDITYSPDAAWDSVHHKLRYKTFPQIVSSHESARLNSNGGNWPTQGQVSSVFSRLGEKVPECTTEVLQFQTQSGKRDNSVTKQPSLSSQLKLLTTAKEKSSSSPLINADLLNRPPLSANDISKLLIETNTNSNSNSNSNSFDYSFAKHSSTVASSPSEPSTFDMIRKKLASLTKGNSSPSDKGLPSISSTSNSHSASKTCDRFASSNTKTTAVESAANSALVNVLPTLRPNDPRLRRATSLLNSAAPPLPQTLPQPSLSSTFSNQIPTIVSKKVVPASQPIQVLQQGRAGNFCLEPNSRQLPSYIPTLTSIQCNATSEPIQLLQQSHAGNPCPQTNPCPIPPYIPALTAIPCHTLTPLMSMKIATPLSCKNPNEAAGTTTNGTGNSSAINPNKIISSDSLFKQNETHMPLYTSYVNSSDENWDTDDNVGTATNATAYNSAINPYKTNSPDSLFKHNETPLPLQSRYIDSSDENWDTDDNACDYGKIRTASTTAPAQAVHQQASEERSQVQSSNEYADSIMQRGNAAATPLMQRRKSISFHDGDRLSEEPESGGNSARSYQSSSGENPFKRSLPNSFEASRYSQTSAEHAVRSGFEDGRGINKNSPDNMNFHYRYDGNEIHRNSNTVQPPPRRKSMCWENNTQQSHTYNSRYSNPATIRNIDSNNSPQFVSNISCDRFKAKINDSVERSKYLESKKQKAEPPRTYGAYKEAKARAEAEARKLAESNKPKEVEPPVISTITPAPIANSTLDNLYRSKNMKSCELPKANIGSFKIPKKQTTVEDPKNIADHSDKTERNEKIDENSDETKEAAKKIQEKSNKEETKKIDKTKLNRSEKKEGNLPIETKEITKQNAVKINKANEKNDLENENSKHKSNEASKKFLKVDHENTNAAQKPLVTVADDKAKSKHDEGLKPKPQRACFKSTTKKQSSNEKKIIVPSSIRDPRLEKKPTQAACSNNKPGDTKDGANSINVSDHVEELHLKLEGKSSDRESSIFNDSGWQIIDEVYGSDVEVDGEITTSKSALNEDSKIVKNSSPQKKFEDLLNSPIKPRRILTRRCTMIDQASAPEVDKEKLSKANAMLFEDLQELERKKKAAAEAAKAQNSSRRYTGEICYDKTDDGCTVSTQNIISGKRRTRTTVNFNEVQQGIAVFKHLKKLPESGVRKGTETEKDAKTVATSSTVGKERKKPGPKPKPLESETEISAAPAQISPSTTTKQIRKRKQTFVQPTLPVESRTKQRRETDEEGTAALPNVTNIFDSFIQKILHPETDAEELINKLRDILNESEVQTLLDVRAAMSKKHKTSSAATTPAATVETAPDLIAGNKKAAIEKETSTKCASLQNIETKETPSDKLPPLPGTTKGKHYKTELDRLHDDIRDMFISEGVLTATGRRMCTFVKPTASTSTLTAKAKAHDSDTLEIAKTETTTNNVTVNISALPARKTRSALATTAEVASKSTSTVRNLRNKQISKTANKDDSNDTEISNTSNTDVSLNCNVTFTMLGSSANLDSTPATQSDSSENVAALRDMPELKPAKPIRLPEEDELEELLAKTKHAEINKDKIARTTPTTKLIAVKKRKKPCPKSKKPPSDSTDDDDNYDEDENVALIKIKQELLDISVPYKEPSDAKLKKLKSELKNINPKWHFQSRYAHACAVCHKRVSFMAMHCKRFHRENYSSRLAPSILHQLRVDNASVSKPILKFAPPKTKNKQSQFLWLHRCPFCLQYKRTSFNSWMQHFICHTGEHCYECTLCHASCFTANAIEKHMADRCLKEGGRYLHNDEISIGSKATTVTAHICHLCNFLRLGRSGLERHYVEQHNCDVKEAKHLGYTIVLMDFENVPLIETLEEALEVQEKLSSQFNGQFVDLFGIENDSDTQQEESIEYKQQGNKKRKIIIKTKGKEHMKLQEVIEHRVINSNEKNLQNKTTKENEESQEKLLKLVSTNEKAVNENNEPETKKNTPEEGAAKVSSNKQFALKISETSIKETKEPEINNTLHKTPPKVTISNAFMSTTDDSNDEEAATSKMLVDEIFNTNSEVEVSTNSAQKNKIANNAVTMAERLSQRLKEAEKKAISLTNQQQHSEENQLSETTQMYNPSLSCRTAITETASENSECEVDLHDGTIEINDTEEEDDGWEDIEIVESAPSANSSMTSHTSSLSGSNLKTHKGKMNNLQKFSRFVAAPNAIKSRKKNNKGLKSLITLLSDNATSENESTEVSLENTTLGAQRITTKPLPTIANTKLSPPKDMQANPKQMPTIAPTRETHTVVTDITSSTTSNQTTTINSTTTSALGFRPLITNIIDLLPDPSVSDPLEIVTGLTPSDTLQDLKDLTSFLGENLNNMDMEVDASSHSVCIHNMDNRETSIQDALDFVSSQTENYELAGKNKANTDLMAVTAPIIMNRVQNVGFNCATLSDELLQTAPAYKFYCLSDRCTFLFSSEAIGLQNHFLFEHPQAKWNGYCETCATQVKFVAANTEFSYTEELDHLLQVHIKHEPSQKELKANIEETSCEKAPRIKLRRLSGDCLSTQTGSSTSSSNAGLIGALDDSNSFSDLIRFNQPRIITLSSEESQSAQASQAAQNTSNQIEISCMSNDASEPLFKNIGNDFQITSISSGLEPNEFSEIVKNVYHQNATPSINEQQAPMPLLISNVMSLYETPVNVDSNAPVSETPQTNMNTISMNNQSHPVFKTLLGISGDTENVTTPTTSNFDAANKTQSDVETPITQAVEEKDVPNAPAPLPKITNVCSLNSNPTQHRAASLWSRQIASEREELAQSAAESIQASDMRLTNENARHKASRAARTPTPTSLTKTQSLNTNRNSPEPLIVSEIVPVAQAKAGNFVITQTVSAQYNEDIEVGSNSTGKPTLGFNISISAAELSTINPSVDLTTDNEEQEQQQQQQALRKLPPFKCMERTCNFDARHFVGMINHIKIHDLKNDSERSEYLRCSVCKRMCSNVDDYTNHIRSQHFASATPITTQRSLVSSTTSNIMSTMATSSTSNTSSNTLNTTLTGTDKAATALTEKIRNILNGKHGNFTVGATTVSNCSVSGNLQNSEDIAFKEQLYEIIKNMVAKTGIPANKIFRCLVNNCNVKLNEENYNTHVLYHLSTIGNLGNGPFSCPHCKIKFGTIPLLKKHFKDHARHNFFCYFCLETASNADMIAQHYADMHNFKKNLISYELLRTENSNGTSSVVYYVAHLSPLSKENVHAFGKKLIIEWQRKKAATRTHFKPEEVELLPMQAIFSRDIFCGVCQYKSKVRTNMYRHLLQHKTDTDTNCATDNAASCQAYGATSSAKCTFMDPVNPVPCLISNEKHFDRMTNLASSSHGSAVPQGSNVANATATTTSASAPAVEATCKLRYAYVTETKRFTCGVPGCQYLTISEEIFRAHLTTLHKDVRSYSCALCNEPVCKKTFASDRVIKHLRFHDRTMFQCEKCKFNHYIRYVVEKHVLESHGHVQRTRMLVFVRNEEQPLEGVKSIVTVFAKKSKESSSSEGVIVDSNATNVSATQSDSSAAQTSTASLLRKQRNSIEINTRPLWQRDDPNRIRQIRGIPMEDEAESEKLRKRLRLTEDYEDEEDGNGPTSSSNDKLYLNCFEFGCFHCETKTLNLQDLRTHWRKTHSTASNFATTKPFHFRLLKRLKCAECQSFYGCPWELSRHLMSAHKKNKFYAADYRFKKLVCAFCDFECANAAALQRHSLRECHAAHDIKGLTAMQMVQTMRLESDEDPAVKSEPLVYVQCLLCNELFCSGHEVAKHAHDRHTVDIERFSFREYKNTILYRCYDCAFTSAEEILTLRHMINHYNRFKRCHFCLEPQTTFNGYMQHYYSEHRGEIHRFSIIYPFADLHKFLLRIQVLFPNGWILDKRNLKDTPYGSEERIKELYAEICKTSQEPPIPRLSLGRLVARKSIEARQQQEQHQINASGSVSTADAMQLATQSRKPFSTAKKISKRRSTVATGNDMSDVMKGQQIVECAKRQKLLTLATNIPTPPKFSDKFSAPNTHFEELKPYSFYRKCPEEEESQKIFTNISVGGVNTRVPLEKFRMLVPLNAHVVLEKLNIKELCSARNATKYKITEECEVGSSSGNSTSSSQIHSYPDVKKACPANQKYRFI